MRLDEKVAIVTGGAGGIGRGIVKVLAQRGANVVIADVDLNGAKEAAAEAETLGRESLAVQTDVSDVRSTDGMIANTLSVFGRVDILVNNAGLGGAPEWWTRDEATEGDWDAVYAVNVQGIVHSIESVQDTMMNRMSGKIVNIASIAGRGGSAGPLAHYAASKAAAVNVSQAYALRLAPFNINVNCICPGLIWTPLWEKISKLHIGRDTDEESKTPREYFEERVQRSVPLGREQTPEDIGKLAVFLCSVRARNITGQAINVDGGIYFS